MIIDTIEKKDKNLNDIEWCEYPFYRLFEKIKVNNLKYKVKELPDKPNSEYSLPALTSAAQNQGLKCYVPREGATILKDVITISSNGTPVAFYQTQEFTVLQDAHAFKWIYNNKQLSDNQYLFLVSTINKAIRDKYAWKHKSCLKRITSDTIRLPIKNNEIDFEFMESYMKHMLEEAEKRLEKVKQSKYTKHLIDVNDWKKFRVGDLFDVLKGSRLTKANKKEGNINFVSTHMYNNGIDVNKIGNTEHIHPANSIIVVYDGHATGKAYYQNEPYWASDSVNVLYPKFVLNELIALFLVLIFETVGKNFGYVNKWNQEIMQKTNIYLPVTSDGNPDWQYMENYMQKIYNDATKTFKMLYPNVK